MIKHLQKGLKILALFSVLVVQSSLCQNFPEVRVAGSKRNFHSLSIEKKIQQMQQTIQDKELAWMFGNCFPNTLDRTVKVGKKGNKYDTFVITGDIHAMWLRDCSAQVWPYMPFLKDDKELQHLIQGIINRQVDCVLIDPYANAFNYGKEGSGWESDNTEMRPELHERKWEIDGLCYVIRLAYRYWKITGDNSCFDDQWHKAMQTILSTFRQQQRKDSKGPYRFTRNTDRASETQFGDGYGNPVRPTGMICSMFRPSDDATIYPYLVPSNCFAVVSLRQLAEMETDIRRDNAFAAECNALANEVDNAIQRYAVVNHPKYGKIFAFEVDGYGNYLMMDDANVPSLLSLPYLGYLPADNKIYQNTRKFVWSLDNPYFYKGKFAEGIGGPHVGENMIWPMSIIIRALTSKNEAEISDCLRMLKRTHASTGFMHESFHKDNPGHYTRSWFAWANTLFGELMIKVEQEYPALLQHQYE